MDYLRPYDRAKSTEGINHWPLLVPVALVAIPALTVGGDATATGTAITVGEPLLDRVEMDYPVADEFIAWARTGGGRVVAADRKQ
ncbi:hypothetical protein ACWCXB_33920 [Streptomyces sp. NPDC001514]